MKLRYLLDANILSDVMRRPQGAIAAKIEQVGDTSIATSIVVAAEMRYGAMKRKSRLLSSQLEMVMGRLTVLPFDVPADAAYAKLRTALESKGTPIGANDMLIAAHALSLGLVLVTDNVREFSRVAGLKVENWLR